MFRILFSNYKLRTAQKAGFLNFFILIVLLGAFISEVLCCGTFESEPMQFSGMENHQEGDYVEVDLKVMSVIDLQMGTGKWLLLGGTANDEAVLSAISVGNSKYREYYGRANEPTLSFNAKLKPWDSFNFETQSRFLELQSVFDEMGLYSPINPTILYMEPYFFNYNLFLGLIALGVVLVVVSLYFFFKGGFERRA